MSEVTKNSIVDKSPSLFSIRYHRTLISGLAALALGAQILLIGKPTSGQRMPFFAINRKVGLPAGLRIAGYDQMETFRNTVSVAAYGSTAEYRVTLPRRDSIAILLDNVEEGSQRPSQIILAHGFETKFNSGLSRRIELPSTTAMDFQTPTTMVSGDFNPPQTAAEMAEGRSADLVVGFQNASTLALVADPDKRTFDAAVVEGGEPAPFDPMQRPIVETLAGAQGHVYPIPFNCDANGCVSDTRVRALAAQDLNGDGRLDLAIIADGTFPIGSDEADRGAYLFICINDGEFHFHCANRGWIASSEPGSGGGVICSTGSGTATRGSSCIPDPASGAFSQTFGLTELPHGPGQLARFIGVNPFEHTVYVIRFVGDIDRAPSELATVETNLYPALVASAAILDFDGDRVSELAAEIQPPRTVNQGNEDVRGFDFENHPFSYLQISRGEIRKTEGRQSRIIPIVESDEQQRGGRDPAVMQYRKVIPMLVADFVNQDQSAASGTDSLPEIVIPSTPRITTASGSGAWGAAGMPGAGISNPYLSFSSMYESSMTIIFGAVGEFMPLRLGTGTGESGVYRPDIAVVTKPNYPTEFKIPAYRDVYISANVNAAPGNGVVRSLVAGKSR